MNILYIANARMPTEKAHGIQIAKMCEAFVVSGAKVTLVVPNRRTISSSVREYYDLGRDIFVLRLPVIDTYKFGPIGFIIGSMSFMFVSFLFVWWRRVRGERFIVYTVDMDTFSSSLLPLVGVPVFTEMHNSKSYSRVQRLFFRSLSGVIAVNRLLADEFKKKFHHSRVRYLVEPNGVDLELFKPRDKFEARRYLGLSEEEPIVLYVGRFFDWKGLEIIPDAVVHIGRVVRWYLVGGTSDDFIRVTQRDPAPSMTFVGSVSQAEVVLWLAAADVLLVLGTQHDAQSYYYTSPMKLFEYLLSERIIVASGTPALHEIVSENEVLFYTPDSAEDLAAKVREALEFSVQFDKRVSSAITLGRQYSWHRRAERILKFMCESEKEYYVA